LSPSYIEAERKSTPPSEIGYLASRRRDSGRVTGNSDKAPSVVLPLKIGRSLLRTPLAPAIPRHAFGGAYCPETALGETRGRRASYLHFLQRGSAAWIAALCWSVTGMGAQPWPFSHTKSNLLAAGEWQPRHGFFNDVLSTLSPRSWIVVPAAATCKAKNSQPFWGTCL